MTTTLEHPTNRPSPDSPDTGPKRWRLRTKVLIGVGTTVVVVGGIGVLDCAVSETQHQTRVFHQQVTALDTDLSSGSLRVVGGDTSDVTVEMTVHRGMRSPSHSETVVNGRLLLRSACDFGFTTDNCSVDYVIHAPPGVAVIAHGDGGNIDLVSMAGDADVSVNGGRVRLNFSDAPHHARHAPAAARSSWQCLTMARRTAWIPAHQVARRASTCAPTRQAITSSTPT